VVGYAIVGAAIFERLESGYEIEQRNNFTSTFMKIRKQYVTDLWNITGMQELQHYIIHSSLKTTFAIFVPVSLLY